MQMRPQKERHPSQRELNGDRHNNLNHFLKQIKIHPSLYQHLRKTSRKPQNIIQCLTILRQHPRLQHRK